MRHPSVQKERRSGRYLTDHARANLAGSGIDVPRLDKYIDQLLHFMEAHPEITAEAMT